MRQRHARRGRRSGRIGVGGLALALSSGVVLGGAPGAGAATPAATAVCTVEDGDYDVDVRATGLPRDRVLHFLLFMESPDDSFFIEQIPVFVREDGTYEIPSGIHFNELPVEVSWVIYEDTDENGRWTIDVDDTIFRGDGDVTACPQTVTLSPK